MPITKAQLDKVINQYLMLRDLGRQEVKRESALSTGQKQPPSSEPPTTSTPLTPRTPVSRATR